MADAEPEDERIAVPVALCQRGIAHQRIDAVPALLDGQDGAVRDAKDRQQTVAGGDQAVGIRVNRAQLGADFPAEAGVEAAVPFRQKIVPVDAVFAESSC